MLKEIYEQPQAIIDTVSGRINPETGSVDLPEMNLSDEDLQDIDRIFLVACGTSWHAALVAKYWIERWAGIPVEVDIASEFRYRKLLIDERVLTVSISQSGETADTLAGIRLAKDLGSKIVTICNVVGSTMTREAHGTVYTHAGLKSVWPAPRPLLLSLQHCFFLRFICPRGKGRWIRNSGFYWGRS